MKVRHQYKIEATGEIVTIELEINTDEIGRLFAARLIRSKHGKAQSLRGGIKARLIGRSAA